MNTQIYVTLYFNREYPLQQTYKYCVFILLFFIIYYFLNNKFNGVMLSQYAVFVEFHLFWDISVD